MSQDGRLKPKYIKREYSVDRQTSRKIKQDRSLVPSSDTVGEADVYDLSKFIETHYDNGL